MAPNANLTAKSRRFSNSYNQYTVQTGRLLQNGFGARLVDCSKMRRFLTKVVGFGAIYLSHVDNDRLLQNLPYTCG